MKYHVFLLICYIDRSFQQIDYNLDGYEGWRLRMRLIELTRNRYKDSIKKIEDCNEIKFMYEESPHFESGYVVGEIIERYRKMVELVHWTQDYEKEIVFSTMYRLRSLQTLYFEVYHLVQMLHEIPRKYEHKAEFQDLTGKVNYEDIILIEKNRAEHQRLREKERRKQRKLMREMREAYARGQNLSKLLRRPRDRYFDLDYGWEIDKSAWLP